MKHFKIREKEGKMEKMKGKIISDLSISSGAVGKSGDGWCVKQKVHMTKLNRKDQLNRSPQKMPVAPQQPVNPSHRSPDCTFVSMGCT